MTLLRKRIFSCFCILSFASLHLSAADNYPVGARSAALAYSSVTIADVWSCFNNQAALASLQNTVGGVSFDERFTISNLSTEAFAFALPTKAGTFGLSGTEFGYSEYNEKKVGLAYAKRLGENISAGVQVDYLNTFINDAFYGSKTTFAVEGGLLAEPIKNFTIGFHIFNPTRAKLAEYDDERIPTIIRLGGSFKFSEKVLWSAEEEKDIDKSAVFKSGIEYHIVEALFLRTGIGTNPTLFSFGFGLRVKQFTIDAASAYYQVLGFSPSFSMSYNFK